MAYIETDNLIYKLHNLCKINCAHYPAEQDIYCDMCELGDVIKLIKGCPAADVKPVVRGKWEINHYPVAECQVCKHLTDISTLTSINYCPNCGADLREVDDG